MSAPTCRRCGVQGGPGSEFRKSLCEDCFDQSRRRSDSRSALVHVGIFIGAVWIYFQGSDGLIAWLLFAFAFIDLVGMVATTVHEAAHALIGAALGLRVREISLGVGPRLAQLQLGRVRLVVNLYPVSGHTAFIPGEDLTRTRLFLATLAGPVSHLPLAWMAATVLPTADGWDLYRNGAILYILATGALNLVPFRGSDGRSLINLLTMPDQEIGGYAKVGAALETAHRLVEIERGVGGVAREDRDPFLAHVEDPHIRPRERAMSLNNLAVVDLSLRDPDLLEEADRSSAEAMETLPDHPAIRGTRGSVLIALGRDVEGVELLEPTLARTPREQLSGPLGWLALAYARTGKVFEARRHIATALELPHRTEELKEAMALAGALEARVARTYLDGRTMAEAAQAIRNDAGGPPAVAFGTSLAVHIAATGRDRDLIELARILAGRAAATRNGD